MRRTNRVLMLLSVSFMAVVLTFVLSDRTDASSKFAKETGKKCLDCHKKLPKKGDKELNLTELGQKFKDNGNKMP